MMKTTPNVIQAVPFLAVADITASVRFYVEGLGFEVTRQWIDAGKLRWCWLRNGGAALMLQEYRTVGLDSWTPTGKAGEGVSIFFICQDALEIHRQLRSRGIAASQPIVGNGMWITSLNDPDGYRIEFESETDAPEGTFFTWPEE
jgi:lactoylglutathione lyase